jgi:3-oxoacyl-[acyl-carrier protein] reductase
MLAPSTSGHHWCEARPIRHIVNPVGDTSGGLRADRVAIVTGGSRGVGAEVIRRLADLEYAVVVNYAHDQQAAESIVEAILAGGGAAVAVRADVTDELDVERMFDETIAVFGAIDAVVHTVRGHLETKRLRDTAIDEFDALCRMSLRANLIVTGLAARHVRDGGAIVNVITTVGEPALPYYAAQAIVTAAIEALTQVLAVELRDRDIAVNAVALEVDQPISPGTTAELIAHLVHKDRHGAPGQVIHPSS